MAKKPNKSKGRITTARVQDNEGKPVVIPVVDVKPEFDDHEDMGEDGLNIRRRAFVEHITSTCFGNARRAAEKAGYASDNVNALDVTACRLLSNAKVQEAIRNRLASASLSADWTRNAIASYARASMADFVVLDGNDIRVDWPKAAAAGAIGQIREIKEDLIPGGDGREEVIKRTFKIRDPMPALNLLAKMHGMVTETPGTNVNVTVHQMSEDDLVRIATSRSDRTATPDAGEAVPSRLR